MVVLCSLCLTTFVTACWTLFFDLECFVKSTLDYVPNGDPVLGCHEYIEWNTSIWTNDLKLSLLRRTRCYSSFDI